ncbi:expansin family protein [Russula aff. rugulosa BPL654]|nr:expansin family protein [Russula aff. rugulosa BPL654]
MYKLTLILFAFFSLVLPILAAPVPASDEVSSALTGSGRGTWFDDGLGSCGQYNTNSDPIVALSTAFGTAYCGRVCSSSSRNILTITIHYKGKTTTAIVRDSCPSCGDGDIDMSRATFQSLAPLSVGVLGVNWSVN